MAIRRTPARSPRRAQMRCGAPTRRASTPRRTGGAGSSGPSITAWTSSWAGTRRRSVIAGPRSSPCATSCARCSAVSRRKSPGARGLRIRCDWGPQYIADAWINEVKWLGMTITPSYVGEPECNGVIERFMRTLKEQCLYLHRFQTLAEARRIIGEFIARYNTEWLIERLGHQTPIAARAAAMAA